MAPKVEFEGKDVDAAVELACRELNVGKEQLKYDVLSYGATGIFGIVGAKKAKIRVKGPGAAKKSANSGRKKPPPAESGKEDVGKKPKEAQTEAKADRKEKPPQKKAPPERAPEAAPESGSTEAAAFEPDDNQTAEEERLSLSELEAAASTGKQMLQRILDAISDESRIVVELEGNQIYYDVKGENPAVLIGKRGQTLEAIQYLVDKSVKQQQRGGVRVVVDVEGYWENRRASLEEMALRMAEKAKETGKPITLGQMNAQDRRIVHVTLKEDPTVKTQSRGEGFFRKLVIFPRKTSQRKSRQRNG